MPMEEAEENWTKPKTLPLIMLIYTDQKKDYLNL